MFLKYDLTLTKSLLKDCLKSYYFSKRKYCFCVFIKNCLFQSHLTQWAQIIVTMLPQSCINTLDIRFLYVEYEI